jgi:hypothetical protein
MQRAGRSISPMFPRGLTTRAGRFQSMRNPDRPGSGGVSISLRSQCLRIRGKSMPRQGDRTAIARCEPRFRMLSPNGTTPQVDQAAHTEAFADFAQLRATGREETAQQPIPAKLLDLNLPTLGATAQALENLSQLRRDRSLSASGPHLLSSLYPVRKCVASVDENGPNGRGGTRSVNMARAICQCRGSDPVAGDELARLVPRRSTKP